MKKHKEPSTNTSLWKRTLSTIGPGVITGAADDDPSGIATYSIAGAQFGTSFLWTAFLTWPLAGCVQMMCARIGMVTGMGLASALKKKFSKRIMLIASTALFLANSLNIGSDLSGMGDALELLTGYSSHLFILILGGGICAAVVHLKYHQIAMVLKWLAAALFVYVITAFMLKPDWVSVARDTFVPSFPRGSEAWATLVAILGTTISPYLFFWQAAQEVEEEKEVRRYSRIRRQKATEPELKRRMIDVGLGTFFSNFIMYFIILTAALALHNHGITNISSTREAATALEPFAGRLAVVLYTAGLLGVGLLAIPTLSGSAAYALSETLQWSHGLNKKLQNARKFYAVIIFSTVIGMIMDFLGMNPIKALFWTGVVNGLLAPFLLVGIYLVATDSKIMLGQISPRTTRMGVGITILLMFGAGVGMFVL